MLVEIIDGMPVGYMTREDIIDLRGMSPASLRVLEKMMSEKGLQFKREVRSNEYNQNKA